MNAADRVLRITLAEPDDGNGLLHLLMRAGVVEQHSDQCFDILPPAGCADPRSWANVLEVVASRFGEGFLAASAPRMKG